MTVGVWPDERTAISVSPYSNFGVRMPRHGYNILLLCFKVQRKYQWSTRVRSRIRTRRPNKPKQIARDLLPTSGRIFSTFDPPPCPPVIFACYNCVWYFSQRTRLLSFISPLFFGSYLIFLRHTPTHPPPYNRCMIIQASSPPFFSFSKVFIKTFAFEIFNYIHEYNNII